MSSRAKIFVVEDEALIAMELVDVLEELGYEVCGQVARGEPALEMIPRAQPDLVLMDINLGAGMNGLTVAAALRKDFDVPIIFLTAYSDKDVAVAVAETKSYAFLVKPFKPQALRANIEISLERYSTEMKLREVNRKLRVSERRFRRVVEHIWDGLIVVDASGYISFANDRISEMFGISVVVERGARWESLVAPQWRAQVKAALQDVGTKDSETRHLTFQGQRVDGPTIWVDASFVAIRDDEQCGVGVQVALKDVSEQRRTRAAQLRLSGELARLSGNELFSAMTSEICEILDVDIGFICSLSTGDSRKAWSTSFVADGKLMPVDEIVLDEMPCAMAVSCGSMVIERDASVLYPKLLCVGIDDVHGYVGIALRDSTGAAIGVLGVMSRRAISDASQLLSVLRLFSVRAGAEMERMREQRRFQSLFEFSPDAIVMVNSHGQIDLANHCAEMLFGYSREELEGMDVEMLVPSHVRHAHGELRRSYQAAPTLRRMKARDGQLLAQHKDGSSIPVEIALSPCTADHEPHIVVSIRDISDRLKAKSDFDSLSSKLSRAERLEAIGMLAGGASHDFNNLLTAIMANVELARRTFPSQHPAKQRLETISLATERATMLVRSILAADALQVQSHQEQSVVSIVEETAELLRASLPDGVQLDVRVGDGVPKVALDATQMFQVLMNLCTNAVQALDHGRGRIVMSLERLVIDEGEPLEEGSVPGAYALLSVADDGRGIEEANLATIFETFYTTNRDGSGTGLGLAIVKRVAQEQGWKVSVASKPGKGATFKVLLPAVETSL